MIALREEEQTNPERKELSDNTDASLQRLFTEAGGFKSCVTAGHL